MFDLCLSLPRPCNATKYTTWSLSPTCSQGSARALRWWRRRPSPSLSSLLSRGRLREETCERVITEWNQVRKEADQVQGGKGQAVPLK